MFHVVTGGSGSGKSAYAESEVLRLEKLCVEEAAKRFRKNSSSSCLDDVLGWSDKGTSCQRDIEDIVNMRKLYVATMEPFGEETKQKIERHRRLRAGKGFETIECYTNFHGCMKETFCASQEKEKNTGKENQLHHVEMLEKSSNHIVLLECMSNLVANELYRPDGAKEHTVQSVLAGIDYLLAVCEHLVVVTNEVFSDGREESDEMQYYKKVLAMINAEMAKRADAVTEVVYGIPVEIKR